MIALSLLAILVHIAQVEKGRVGRENFMRRKIKSRRKHRRRKEGVANLLGRFSNYLTYRRNEQGLTLRAFAVRAGLSPSHIYELEKQGIDPRLSDLHLLARGFNESLGAFLRPLLAVDDVFYGDSE